MGITTGLSPVCALLKASMLIRMSITTARRGFSLVFVQVNVRIKLIPNISADNPTRTSHSCHSKKYFPIALTTARIHSVARKVVDKRDLPPQGALSYSFGPLCALAPACDGQSDQGQRNRQKIQAQHARGKVELEIAQAPKITAVSLADIVNHKFHAALQFELRMFKIPLCESPTGPARRRSPPTELWR